MARRRQLGSKVSGRHEVFLDLAAAGDVGRSGQLRYNNRSLLLRPSCSGHDHPADSPVTTPEGHTPPPKIRVGVPESDRCDLRPRRCAGSSHHPAQSGAQLRASLPFYGRRGCPLLVVSLAIGVLVASVLATRVGVGIGGGRRRVRAADGHKSVGSSQ